MSYDTIITLPPVSRPVRLSDWLRDAGRAFSAPCGGRGVCGKCRVEVVSGVFPSATRPGEAATPDAEGRILACQALCPPEGGVVRIAEERGGGLAAFCGLAPDGAAREGAPADTGVALDVGTTTLAAALVGLADGRVLATAAALNPQRAWGADVLNRIGACARGQLAAQQEAVLGATRALLSELAAKAPEAPPPRRMAVAGNPTMLHLFAGISPEGMGRFPFTPAFLERRMLDGRALGLPLGEVTLLASAAAFLGSDVMCGVLASGMAELDEPSVLLDIGTNGEMVLCAGRRRGGRLVGVSAAAGPALEGATLSCGTGGVRGAVCRVRRGGDGVLRYRTIDDADPVGVCGCGLVDWIARLLEEGALDGTGALEVDPTPLCGIHETAAGRALGARGLAAVSLTQRDIREAQLAKAAMRAGLEALLSREGVAFGDVRRLFIAGGLGVFMDGGAAVRVGLLPGALLPVAETVGNSSLAGAVRCLADAGAMEALDALAGRCETFELNGSPVFEKAFVEQMPFPEG